MNTAKDLFNSRAKEYEEKFMNVEKFANGLDFFCDAIPAIETAVLELACGPGNLTRYILNKKPSINVLGTDIAPNMIQLAKKNNPEAKFQILDCRDVSQLKQKFAGVVCGFCLPYLSPTEVMSLLKECSRLLTDKGVLYISAMEHIKIIEGVQTSSNGEQLYTYFHQNNFIKAQLMENKFEIVYSEKIIEQNSGEPFSIHDYVLIAQK